MAVRTLNSVQLIGNVVASPQLEATERGSSVCTFHLITDREWKTSTGELKKSTERHACVAWGKLAEICSNMFNQGDRVYVKGYLTYLNIIKNNVEESVTEVVVEDMIFLS